MKYVIFPALLLSLFTACKSTQVAPSTTELNNSIDSLSYSIGVSIAENMKQQGIDSVNHNALAKGITDRLTGSEVMDLEACDAYAREQINRLREEKSEKAREAGVTFLEENKSKDGVQVTETGLQYKVITEGTGASPDGNDRVTVHYEGRLIDGTPFDSSIERGRPATFGLNGVIPGWTEGIPTMKVGGKTTFYIPQELGYGSRPAPGGAYSTLVFDVELLEVEPVE
jgi:FKBP-type peptidyl-prolyl cis-trans isomerase FklB